MPNLINDIIATLSESSDSDAIRGAMLDAAFLFEKSRGLAPSAWSASVVAWEGSPQDIDRLEEAVVRFVEKNGYGSWTLSKRSNPAHKDVFVGVIRRQVDGDAGELFEAMIHLDWLGENVFQGREVRSDLDEALNRQLARDYLQAIADKRVQAEISFDLLMEDDMAFVEGSYRLPGLAWEVVIVTRYDAITQPVAHTGRRWDSGVTGINVEWPRSMKLNKAGVLQLLSETLGVTDWVEVRGPDSMQLR